MNTFDKARSIKDLNTLYDFITELSLNKDSPVRNVAAAAIATVFTLKQENIFNLADYQISEVMWLFIDNLTSEKDKNIITTTLETRKTLFPKPGQPGIVISPEIFNLIQKEAENLLKLHHDAVDSERKYWESLVKGVVPKGITVSEEINEEINEEVSKEVNKDK